MNFGKLKKSIEGVCPFAKKQQLLLLDLITVQMRALKHFSGKAFLLLLWL